MAFRSVELNGSGTPEVNPFIFNKNHSSGELKIKEFKSNDQEWAEFVMKNRDKTSVPPFGHEYDIVIGPVADSSVDIEIRNYKRKYGENYLDAANLKELAQRLKFTGERYIQYCFCTQKAIDQLFRD